ncbi:MAG: diguanylate cyclase [Bacillaceae bacterium]|nr:diguanylate cyclase [Bacillaceae bacterium]
MKLLKRKLTKGDFHPTLMQGVLVRIFVTAIILVALISLASYFYVYNQEKEKRLGELEEYVMNRVKSDSVIFELAEDNLEVFKKEFLRLYTSDVEVTEEDFWNLYFVDEEGATRMYEEQFTGVYTGDGVYRYGMSSFIGNNQSVDDPDFQRRLVLSYRLLAQLGPAWVNRFANVHASFPENGIVLFWPEVPWGLKAKADLPMNELGVIRAVSQEENPERKPLWTGLYYDETAEEWMITYEVPVDYEGKHLINPSHDVYLTDIMDRLISEHPDGGYNYIMRKDGYLIAHPSGPTEEQKWVGQLSLEKIDIPSVIRGYNLIKEGADEGEHPVHIIENQVDNSYLGVGEISGPEWWFVSVLPMQVIQDVAHQAALSYFLQGIFLLFVMLGVVYVVIRFQAETPLRKLRYAAEVIGNGEYDKISNQDIPLPLKFKNEIGLLAKSFVEMATNIANSKSQLEKIVDERTRELEAANAQLQKLSYLDGLTEIRNRRSFDMDIKNCFQKAKTENERFCLMLADVDFFKLYNDVYGHAEGDKVLKQISRAIQEVIGDKGRVYRYGGEEIAILLRNCDAEKVITIGEHILSYVRSLQIPHQESRYKMVTLSIGVAQYTEDYNSPEELIKAADQKLYHSKVMGRNQLSM